MRRPSAARRPVRPRSTPSSPERKPLEPHDHLGASGLRRPQTTPGSRRRRGETLVNAINALARNPEPTASSKLGNTNLRRLRVGVYRATYEIDGDTVAIKILMVGGTAV
ncbi:type II toxin-antitoxin system RelE/ParE family toxin [Streptomyces sp. NPDC056704]|uniref:type II toxin-antitoxin system RelE family toxin n=1 Tax=Streptomyces sp. NPDC056704 TaxID=3345917 RepID=UPI0036773A93